MKKHIITNEEKALNISGLSDYEELGYNAFNRLVYDKYLEMARWKDEQTDEAKELLRLCYNTILGITSLDTSEEIAKARKSHDSSLIKRIELFLYNNQ